MNDTRMDELLAEMRKALHAAAPRRTSSLSGCLTFERARALTLNPARWRTDERGHVARCHRCERLLQSFERDMPHLSLWWLVRKQLGGLTEDEQRAVDYHLERGECERCRAREARLGAVLDRVVQFPGPVPLPYPAAVVAAVAELSRVARSRDADFEAELFEDGSQVTLEVRTKDAALNHHLVGYVLRGGQREEANEGYMVLRPDVEGWFAASTTFEAGELHSRLNGRCEEVLVSPLYFDLLEGAEREALLASATHSREDTAARAAWAEWVTEAVRKSESLSEKAWQLLCEVRRRLGG